MSLEAKKVDPNDAHLMSATFHGPRAMSRPTATPPNFGVCRFIGLHLDWLPYICLDISGFG
jgi:hypothetical protein